jgi:hypothetical protein
MFVRGRRPELAWIGAEMVKQAGTVAWLLGLVALNAIATWSGLSAVGHAVATVGTRFQNVNLRAHCIFSPLVSTNGRIVAMNGSLNTALSMAL